MSTFTRTAPGHLTARSQRRIAEPPHHGGINEIQHGLGDHPTDNGQRQTQYSVQPVAIYHNLRLLAL